jgi:hypothetical protein
VFKILFQRLSKSSSTLAAAIRRVNSTHFKRKPAPRVLWGVAVVAVSYLACWPVIGLLGLLSAYTDAPRVFTIGGPVAFAASQLLFILGAWLSGGRYAGAYVSRGIRFVFFKKTLRR